MESDPQLVARIGQGDRSALAQLYRELEKPVFRFIRSRLNDPFESADLLHDVFIEVWRSASRFEGRSKVKTWIFGIAYRKVVDLHRKRGRMTVSDNIPESVDESPGAEACLAAGQEAVHVRYCMGKLKDDHRSAIAMAFYDDMTYSEIAEVAEVPEGTIKTRIFHAKKLLLHCLSDRVLRGASV